MVVKGNLPSSGLAPADIRHVDKTMNGQEKCIDGTRPRAPDNRYGDCPSRMSDGRLFTDYRPRCEVHSDRLVPPDQSSPAFPFPMKSHDRRQLMIQHADELIRRDRLAAMGEASCGSCTNESTMLPPSTVQMCDAHTCIFRPTNPDKNGGVPFPAEKGIDEAVVTESGLARNYTLSTE